MTQASWNGSASTLPTFINNLFSSSVRSLSAVQTQITAGQHSYSFTDDATRGLILNAWLAAWQSTNGDNCSTSALAMCPATDKTLIGFLSQYIKNNNLLLCKPTLTYVSPQPNGASSAVYSNSGYATHQFLTGGKWNYGAVSSDGQLSNGAYPDDTVVNFLFQLFHGAHIVAISNPQDLNNNSVPSQLWVTFLNSDLVRGGDKLNSHYGSGNVTGYYYLNIWRDKEPSENPLIAALLFALTDPDTSDTLAFIGSGDSPATGNVAASNLQAHRDASNTFIQLEGWPSHIPWVTGWHMADYKSHEATLWNFSTFGASVYSEKRSTPIFLANANFSLAINTTTKMPLYVGASGLQSWMNPGLLQT